MTKNHEKNDVFLESRFGRGFERVLGGFWEDFGKIFGAADCIVDSYFLHATMWDKK